MDCVSTRSGAGRQTIVLVAFCFTLERLSKIVCFRSNGAQNCCVLIDACQRAALNTFCLRVVLFLRCCFSHCISGFRICFSGLVEIFSCVRYYQEFPLISTNWLNISYFFFLVPKHLLHTNMVSIGTIAHRTKTEILFFFKCSVARFAADQTLADSSSPLTNNQNQMKDGTITSDLSHSNQLQSRFCCSDFQLNSLVIDTWLPWSARVRVLVCVQCILHMLTIRLSA